MKRSGTDFDSKVNELNRYICFHKVMFYVYILKLDNNSYYIGYSTNLKNRISEHKNGEVHQTINKSFKLVFYAAFESKLKALQFEKYLKTGSGYAFRNKRLI